MGPVVVPALPRNESPQQRLVRHRSDVRHIGRGHEYPVVGRSPLRGRRRRARTQPLVCASFAGRGAAHDHDGCDEHGKCERPLGSSPAPRLHDSTPTTIGHALTPRGVRKFRQHRHRSGLCVPIQCRSLSSSKCLTRSHSHTDQRRVRGAQTVRAPGNVPLSHSRVGFASRSA